MRLLFLSFPSFPLFSEEVNRDYYSDNKINSTKIQEENNQCQKLNKQYNAKRGWVWDFKEKTLIVTRSEDDGARLVADETLGDASVTEVLRSGTTFVQNGVRGQNIRN